MSELDGRGYTGNRWFWATASALGFAVASAQGVMELGWGAEFIARARRNGAIDVGDAEPSAQLRARLAAALAEGGLDQLVHVSGPDGRHASLRRLVCDLIEEYGRRTGHADLLREAVDGPGVRTLRLDGTQGRAGHVEQLTAGPAKEAS